MGIWRNPGLSKIGGLEKRELASRLSPIQQKEWSGLIGDYPKLFQLSQIAQLHLSA